MRSYELRDIKSTAAIDGTRITIEFVAARVHGDGSFVDGAAAIIKALEDLAETIEGNALQIRADPVVLLRMVAASLSSMLKGEQHVHREQLSAFAPQQSSSSERELLEQAIDRMGWEEINAFHAELKRGQAVNEDAGGFVLRAIRRLFGLPQKDAEILTYQRAARAMVEEALRNGRLG